MKSEAVGRILFLTLHREFFAAILSGKKRTEWRKRSIHWHSRLENKTYDAIRFRNGYGSKAPEMIVEFKRLRRYGRSSTGFYGISLGRILSIKRWPPKASSSGREGRVPRKRSSKRAS